MCRSGHTALEDNLAHVVEPLDMFKGGPWVSRDGADTVVGPHNPKSVGPTKEGHGIDVNPIVQR